MIMNSEIGTLQAKASVKKPIKTKAAETAKKETAKKGKRAKAAAVLSSSDESDTVSKKPTAAKKTKISKVIY